MVVGDPFGVSGGLERFGMAFSYLPVDRDQQFLLPPDMRDWLPPGHLVWFVLDVVARVDTSALHERHPRDGVGRRAYDPDMLLALLIYAYCGGVRSSRQIERLCEVDVAFRVICANHVPDHTTIARFRQDHQDDAVRLFTDVLALCAAAGLATVGRVAVDGTKMAANASLKANRTRHQLEAEVAAMFAEAADTDAGEDALFGDARGDELPEDLVDPRRRKARLDAALAEVAQAEAARQAEEQRARDAEQRGPAGSRPSWSSPQRPRGRTGRGGVGPQEGPGGASDVRLLKRPPPPVVNASHEDRRRARDEGWCRPNSDWPTCGRRRRTAATGRPADRPARPTPPTPTVAS